MSAHFQTRSLGKWILTGEHTVLRGSPALVFPLRSRYLEFSYYRSEQPLQINVTGESAAEFRTMADMAVPYVSRLFDRSLEELTGEIHLVSHITVGAGIGASATLSVCMARWLQHLEWISKDENLFPSARKIENLFHGESSGVDVMASLSEQGLKFTTTNGTQPLNLAWEPRFYLFYTGKSALTSVCISKIKTLLDLDCDRAIQIDQAMANSVRKAEQALSQPDNNELLGEAVEQAATCFREWDLVDSEMEQQMQWLKQHGAKAVKPTGSGGGGYLLSLWTTPPPADLRHQLIEC